MDIKLIDTEASVGGTSLMGYIKTTYSEIVDIFGEPRYTSSGDDKVTAEWDLEFEVGGEYVTATIYDWKLGETPFGEYNWHIGGFSTQAPHIVSHYMKGANA
jgi:hypothetical protein